MSELFRLIEDFCAREERKIPWVADKTGIKAKTIYSWQYRPLKKPLAPEDIFAIAEVIRVPFDEVKEASLKDSGYDRESAEAAYRKAKAESEGRGRRKLQDVEGTAPDPEGPELGA